jgi:hypothetical protein
LSKQSRPDTDTQAVRRVQARSRRPSGAAWWLGPLVGLVVGLCGLIGIGLLIGLRPFGTAASVVRPTVLVVTITPSPVVPTPTLPATQAPAASPEPSATPAGLYIGGETIVTGTGSALRLRSDPGLQSTTLKTVTDGTRLKVLEGPRDADDLTWWRLEDPSDGAQGWAAEKYLTPATAP